MILQALLLLMTLCSQAWAQDPHAALQDVPQAETLKMPVEACYIGREAEELPVIDGYIRITIRNGMCDDARNCFPGQPGESAMIYGIRSYTAEGAAKDAVWAHEGKIYMVEGPLGSAIPRSGLAWDDAHTESTRVSMLRPGEKCATWLPRPLQQRWRIYARRLPPRNAKEVVNVIDRCVERFAQNSVDLISCLLRFDRTVYGNPKRYGVEDVVRDGDVRTISWVRTWWSEIPQ